MTLLRTRTRSHQRTPRFHQRGARRGHQGIEILRDGPPQDAAGFQHHCRPAEATDRHDADMGFRFVGTLTRGTGTNRGHWFSINTSKLRSSVTAGEDDVTI